MMPSLRDTAFRRCIWSVFASIGCVSEASDSDTRDVCVLGVYRERVSRSSGRDTCIVQSIERVSMCSVASDHDTCILRRIDCVSMCSMASGCDTCIVQRIERVSMQMVVSDWEYTRSGVFSTYFERTLGYS